MRARLLVLLTAGVLAGTGTGLAAPPATGTPADGVGISRATTAAERAAVRTYWTTQRMQQAVPGHRRVEPMAEPSGQGGPRGGGGGSTTRPLVDIPPTGTPTLERTVGKVFFTLARRDYVCSASTVTSDNQSLVLTAGHCLHEGRGGSRGYATNFLFVPGYDNGAAPHGEWAAVTLYTTSQWAKSADPAYDVGFAVVEKKAAGTLAGTNGAQGITFGRGVGTPTTSYGYPAANPYDGQTRQSCGNQTPTIADPHGQATHGLECAMTGGSSGGPWLTVLNGTTYAHSVNSYKYASGPYANTHMFGPFLGGTAKSLYDSASR